jgi:DNA/RNA-binding domain of Phe-tRNA-synthetase-like protein
MFPEFSLSKKYVRRYPGVGFGLTLVSSCRDVENPPEFKAYKKKHLRKMRKRETLAQISERIDTYADFFQGFGYPCPLVKHLKRTINSGFPQYALFVDAHFMAEMCAGILVAVTDFDRLDGRLTLDVATEGELCAGMGNREFVLKENEIVLRDEKDIVCVLCQGADQKTRVREATRHVLFYAYAVPGIDNAYLEEGLSLAAETVAEFGRGKIEGIEIYCKP